MGLGRLARGAIRAWFGVDVRVVLLGPVGLISPDGAETEVREGKRQAVLALLAARMNQVVPVARILGLVWDGAPPPRARQALQGHVADLRRQLSDSPLAIVWDEVGYEMRGAPETVDALEFRRLAALAASTAEDEEAVALLRRGLGLWRGSALMGVAEGELRRTLGAELEEARVLAVEAWAERALRLGNGGDVVAALEEAVRADGLRESLVGALVRCLHQEGRQSEALEVYHQARRRLRDELGVIPGPQLQAAFATVVACSEQETAQAAHSRPQPPPLSAPAVPEGAAATPILTQLPRLPGGLVGRDGESRWLDRECGPGHEGAGLALITGPAGAGKTVLAVRWAYAVAEQFPDGQLFVDMHGFGPQEPRGAYAVLGHFLRALGMPDERIPEDRVSRAGCFRTITQDMRLLIVLDNAPSAEDVRDLLPAGPGCSTVVTSRSLLGDLVVMEGAAPLTLGTLPLPEALELVARLAGTERVRAEPEMARRLAELCDCMPLALRIAAARLAARPQWTIGALVDELEDERLRLGMLQTIGDSGVIAALASTRGQLTPEAGRLLALLAVHPGGEIDGPAAAALLGCEEAAARKALDVLAAYHLVSEARPGRFSRHDLVRLYCADLLASEITVCHRRQSRARLLDHFMAVTAHAAAFTHASKGAPNSPTASTPTVQVRFHDRQEAVDWYQCEEAAILALIRMAAEDGEPDRAWRLADNCINLHLGRAVPGAWLACAEAGLEAAKRSDDTYAQMRMHYAVGSALKARGRWEEAQREVEHALACASSLPTGEDRLRCRMALGLIRADLDDLDGAIRCIEQALVESRELDHAGAQALALSNLSYLLLAAGQPAAALDRARQATAQLPSRSGSVTALAALLNEIEALRCLGEVTAAEERLAEAVSRCRACGHRDYEATAELWYAELLEHAGREPEARPHRAAAAELSAGRGKGWKAERTSAAISLWSCENR
ncbi:BTAD domain-containing putative transcriptional regulator [Streptomyces sp. NPDC016566]|uniref:AfsR/SARP family transcriptional regulator n=1 Tax=Streptomyces sp. NPDC016566 TaxID=3364967 RepID=UPI0036FB5AC5